MDGDNNRSGFPDVPKEILDAASNGKLIVFIGAGISRLFGLPSWDYLAESMVEYTYENRKKTKKLNYASKSQLLSRNYDPKKLLTISYELHNDDEKEKYLNKMREIFEKSKDNDKGESLLKNLVAMNASFVTTNYDRLIEKYRGSYRNSYKSCNEFNNDPKKGDSPFILHLHGCIDNPKEMVFTIGQYYKMYRKDMDTQDTFKHIFNDPYIILFIGYGLNDTEIVNYLIDRKGSNKHYILEPYTESDKCLINSMESYYKSINVTQLPYFIDEDGYETLCDLIEEWYEEFEKQTYVPANKRNELRKILDEGYSEERSKRVCELLSDDKLVSVFFRDIRRGEYSEKWTESLKDHDCFDPEYILKKIKENNFAYLQPLEHLLAILKNDTESEIIKEIVRKIIVVAMNQKPLEIRCDAEHYYHRLCEELILNLPDQFDESSIKYIDNITRTIDPDISNVIVPLTDNKKLFESYKHECQLLFLKTILEYVTFKGEHWNGYWFNKFYSEIIVSLGQGIQTKMFEPLQSCIKELETKEPYSFHDLGSVEEYVALKRTDDSTKHLIKWFCRTISFISGTKLKDFVKDNLHSGSHLFKTLALHAINLRYDELKDYFWEINDYSRINYSELYELIKNNINNFTNEEISTYVRNVKNSQFSQSESRTNMDRLYKYDLIRLTPTYAQEREELLTEYFVPESDKYRSVENRGKLLYVEVFNWPETTGRFDITDVDKLIELSKIHKDDWEFINDANQFLERNMNNMFYNLNKLTELPPELHHIVYRIIEKSSIDTEEALEFYKRSIQQISDGPYNLLNCTINSLETFVRHNNLNTERVFDLILKNAEKKYRLYSSTEPVIYDDHILTSLNNWYISQLRFLLSNFGYDIVEPNSKRIIDLIECLIKSDIKECRLLIKIFIAYYSGHIIYLDKGWVVDNCKELFIDENSTDIIESLLLSGHCTPEIFDVLISENIFDKLIKKKKESFIDHMNSLGWMGADLAHLYIDYDSRKYEDIIKKSINSMEHCDDFLLGAFTLASHEYESPNKKEKIETLIQMIIDSLSKKTDITGCQLEICKYISKAGAHNPQAKELLKKYSETRILDLRDEMVQTIMNMPAQYIEEQAQITLNLTNSPIRYYPDNFKELVIHLKSNDCDEKTFIEICNTMGSKGYEEYYKYLIE